MSHKVTFVAQRQIQDDMVRLYCRGQDADGTTIAYVTRGLEVVKLQQGQRWPEFITFPDLWEPNAQSLFQALWDVGFRPNEGESSGAHVAALEAHLADMRMIALSAVYPLRRR